MLGAIIINVVMIGSVSMVVYSAARIIQLLIEMYQENHHRQTVIYRIDKKLKGKNWKAELLKTLPSSSQSYPYLFALMYNDKLFSQEIKIKEHSILVDAFVDKFAKDISSGLNLTKLNDLEVVLTSIYELKPIYDRFIDDRYL